jgi:hypothetical protein
MEEQPQLWRAPGNILNKQSRTNDKRWFPRGGGGEQPFTVKNKCVPKNAIEPQTWMDFLDKRPKQQNMDIRFGL